MIAYQLGDESAFVELYNRYSDKIYGYLKSKLRNQSQANDVFQSTYFKLHKSKNLYNSTLPFSPWIFTICRNELINFLRKQKVTLEFFDEDIHATHFEIVEENLEIDFAKLSLEQQTALKMRYYQDSTFEEIARALSTTPSNARQIISRSIKYLRGFYEEK